MASSAWANVPSQIAGRNTATITNKFFTGRSFCSPLPEAEGTSLVELGYRHTLNEILVEFIAIRFESEVVAPHVDEFRVVDLPTHRVPLFVVGDRVPAFVFIAIRGF